MTKWTPSNCPSQRDKVAIVTGANSGIGFETEPQLAQKDMIVILLQRRLNAAEKAKEDILKGYPTARVLAMELDLSHLAEVRKFAEDFRTRFERLDLLINNAGIMISPYQELRMVVKIRSLPTLSDILRSQAFC